MEASVTRAFTFEAAHELPWHPGKCQRLHGHSYRLEVTVQGPVRPDGMVIDFGELSDVVDREIIDRYDHRCLNDLLDNPTAELLVVEMAKLLGASGLPVRRLRLWETANCMVEVDLVSGGREDGYRTGGGSAG